MVDPGGIFVTVDAASAQEDSGTEDRGSDIFVTVGNLRRDPLRFCFPPRSV